MAEEVDMNGKGPVNTAIATGNVYLRDKMLPEAYVPERDQMFFELEDSYGHVFHVGLITFLQCLAFAEETGELPKHSTDWWNGVLDHYHLSREDVY